MSDAAQLALGSAAILIVAAAAAWLLRLAWRRSSGKAPWRAAGLGLAALAILAPAGLLGEARGPFAALALFSVAALSIVASGRTLRSAQAGRGGRGDGVAPEPAERASAPWRGLLRWLLAGPIGMVAAMAVGVCYTVWGAGAVQTRLVVGGLLVPLVWGAAMAWTLADDKLLRAAAVLLGTALVGFGLARLGGVA
ncbi:hypothetical protein CA234_19130 [Sphingomonas sp. ABOLE]|uniref:hypothetical protein n=1 Tax=Sphingomonas sp. ABOLE TaxID=1985878 RepID=UPI000F7DB942|nr:hypothetical protein [Sphingomonas sp. ABOLE]RSV35834.1 hypothetical protein CA234_19130 [Sphingomonas sp. ABOLE]